MSLHIALGLDIDALLRQLEFPSNSKIINTLLHYLITSHFKIQSSIICLIILQSEEQLIKKKKEN